MFCRPVITDLHVQKALNVCKTKRINSPEYNRAWNKALRLIEMKTAQAQFMEEAKELETILEELPQ
jgi:hypothetical protein